MKTSVGNHRENVASISPPREVNTAQIHRHDSGGNDGRSSASKLEFRDCGNVPASRAGPNLKFGQRFPLGKGENNTCDTRGAPGALAKPGALPTTPKRPAQILRTLRLPEGRHKFRNSEFQWVRPAPPPARGWRPSCGGAPASLVGSTGGRHRTLPGQRPILGTGTNRPARPKPARQTGDLTNPPKWGEINI